MYCTLYLFFPGVTVTNTAGETIEFSRIRLVNTGAISTVGKIQKTVKFLALGTSY